MLALFWTKFQADKKVAKSRQIVPILPKKPKFPPTKEIKVEAPYTTMAINASIPIILLSKTFLDILLSPFYIYVNYKVLVIILQDKTNDIKALQKNILNGKI